MCGRTFFLAATLVVGERRDTRCVLSPIVQYTVGILPVTACSTRFLVEAIKRFLGTVKPQRSLCKLPHRIPIAG